MLLYSNLKSYLRNKFKLVLLLIMVLIHDWNSCAISGNGCVVANTQTHVSSSHIVPWGDCILKIKYDNHVENPSKSQNWFVHKFFSSILIGCTAAHP